MIKSRVEEVVLWRFRRAKIMTIAMLMPLLECSRRTTQRRLKAWGCYTSYNCNSAWHALPSTVAFDQYGIWRFKEACFSVYGTMPDTVVGLVNNSEAGLNCAELSAIMGVNAFSFIWRFIQDGSLSREKFAGAYVYMSPAPHIKQQQTDKRARSSLNQLSDADAVTVLVELLNSPSLSPAELSARLRHRAPTASSEAIKRFFIERGVTTAKKKASDSLS